MGKGVKYMQTQTKMKRIKDVFQDYQTRANILDAKIVEK